MDERPLMPHHVPSSGSDVGTQTTLDEAPRPPVKRLCKRCRPTLYPGDVIANLVIVSPLGTAHWGDGGDTACGRDATGDRWWWPL